MPSPFALSRAACSPISAPSLRREISRHTSSEAETAGILRSLERFGGDASIIRYEITPTKAGRWSPKTKAVAWTVRAVRSAGL